MDKKLFILLVLSLLTMTANLNGISIYILDEAKNSVCAREMYESASWVVPTFNQALRPEKPPLHYYFMMLSYAVFGVNEGAARLFSALFGVLTIMLTYVFTKRVLEARTAFLAALVLLASLHWTIQFHLAVPDPYLVFFFILSLCAFYLGYFEKKKVFMYLMYAAVGLAILAQGPVALVLLGAIVVLVLLLRREFSWKNIRVLQPLWGFSIVALLTLPWYIAVTVATDGEWARQFFMKHNVGRYLAPMEGHGGPPWLVPLYVILGLFPFAVFLPQALGHAWHRRSHPLLLLCLVTVTVTVVFFAFSGTKLANYPVPCYPMAAILLGHFLSHLSRKPVPDRWLKTSFVVYLLIAIAIPITLYIVLEQLVGAPELRSLSYYFLLLPVGGLVSLYYLFKARIPYFIGTLSGTWIAVILLFFYVVFPQLDQQNPVQQALRYLQTGQPVYSYRQYNPAFSFYLRQRIPQLDTPEALRQYLNQPNAVVITNHRHLQDLTGLPVVYQGKELFEPSTVTLLSGEDPTAWHKAP